VKRTYRFVQSDGRVLCVLPSGKKIELPVVQGILKHPQVESLCRLLKDPDAARKYRREALRIAPWQVFREFPKQWPYAVMKEARVRPERARALDFMLKARPDN
jgi:hypothetical protein